MKNSFAFHTLSYSFHSGIEMFGFWSEKSEFPAFEKCFRYFSNPDIEENREYLDGHGTSIGVE
jgi:hypothetical protein